MSISTPPMNDRPARKLLILGWDAADWLMIRTLTDKGALPNFRRLMHEGAHADLATLEPRLSPLLWSSIATGKTADKHGILNFVEPDASEGRLRPTSSTSRRTRALWNILHLAGLRTHVVGWYASHPAEPIRGAVVSNLLTESQPANPGDPWPLTPGAVHPPALADRIAIARVHAGAVPDRVLSRLVPQWVKLGRDHPRMRTLARLVAQCLSIHGAAGALLQTDSEWDCAMVFHEAIDTIGHHFMQFHPPRMKHVEQRDFDLFSKVMRGAYELHDELLGQLLRLAGPGVTVMLLSDHGFHSGEQRPVTEGLSNMERAAMEAAWHREHGVLVMCGPGVKPGATMHAPNLLDIAPTALAVLGLPAGRDMDGRVLEEVLTVTAPERITSWDETPGDAGEHPPDLRQDPFEAHDAIRQLIDLGYMAALPEDAQARVDLTRRETAFNLGAVHLARGQTDAAAGIFQSLSDEQPAEPRYALSLARALLAAGRPAPAADALKSLLARTPSHTEASALFVTALAASDRVEEGSAALSSLLTNPEMSPGALGDLCAALGRWDEAEVQYRRALASEPKRPSLLAGLARVLVARGQFEVAAERCLDALEVEPGNPEANHQLGVALAWLGEHAHAVQAFRTVVALQPGRIEGHRFLAALLRQTGDEHGAAEADARAEDVLREQAATPEQRELAERQGEHGPSAWTRAQRGVGT